MTTEPTPAPSFLTVLRTQRQQVAIGLVVAGVILASLSIWWGVWGFARSADSAPAKSQGKLLPDEPSKPDEAKDDGRPKKSPDYQIGAVWAGAIALLAFLSAAWLFTQPSDAAVPDTSTRVELLTFGGTIGLITALCGAFLGYRWHQSLVLWVAADNAKEAKWVLYAAAIFLAGLLIMFASMQLARTEQRANAALRRILYGFNSVFVGLLLLLVLIAINIVSFLKVPKVLVTNDTAFTELTEPSKVFLHSLDRPANVYLIMPEAHVEQIPGTRAGYDNLYADCRGLVTQCEDQSRHFHATFLSPAFDKERIATLMERLKVKDADRDQLGMLVAVGDNEEATSFIRAGELIDLDRAGRTPVFQGENKLLTELMYLTDSRAKEKFYFTQGHGELSIEPGSGGGDKSCSNVVQFLRDRKMTVEPLTFEDLKSKVPDDAAAVVVAGLRRTLTPDDPMVVALQEYVRRPNRPGKLILFLPAFRDPQGKVAATGLEGLLSGFGVDVDSSHRIVASPKQLQGLTADYVLLGSFVLNDPDLARVVGETPIVLRDARPVRPVPAPPGGPFRVSPLMGTNMPSFTWLETDFVKSLALQWEELVNDKDGQLRQEKQLSRQTRPVVAAVTESIQGGEKPTTRPRLIVVGSDTVLQDQTPIRGAEEFHMQFFSNCVDWLRERDASIGIPPRKVGIFALEKPIEWPSQVVLLAMVTIGVTSLGVGVWLSRRR